jgi:hypothetical protein
MMDINTTSHIGLGLFGFNTPDNISMMGHDGFTLEYTAFVYYDVSSKSTFSILVNQRDFNQYSMMLIFEFIKTLNDYIPTSIASEPLVANALQLDQNWPNPFNPSTNISFTLQKADFVQLNVYNILGEKIKTLAMGEQSRGKHSFIWNGKNDSGMFVSSGTYIYRLKVGQFTETKKMLLIR